MVDLAYHSGGEPVSLKEISGREKISISYLEQLFLRLKRGGLVNSVRGPNGGYKLSRPSKEIPLWEIVQLVEEPLELVHCIKNRNKSTSCPDVDTCVVRGVWVELSDLINTFLKNKTLEELRLSKADMERTLSVG